MPFERNGVRELRAFHKEGFVKKHIKLINQDIPEWWYCQKSHWLAFKLLWEIRQMKCWFKLRRSVVSHARIT